MLDVAAKLQAEAAIASCERRKTDEFWTGVAQEIAARRNTPDAGRAALLSSTRMATGS